MSPNTTMPCCRPAPRRTCTPARSRSRCAISSRPYPGPRGGAPVRALDQLSIRSRRRHHLWSARAERAGKSTTVKILTTTLSRPGLGRRPRGRHRRHRSPRQGAPRDRPVSRREASSDPMATGRENLLLAAASQGLSRRTAGYPCRRAPRPVRPRRMRPTGSSRTYSGRDGRAAWMSPSDWCTARRCSSSTSPRPGSTRKPGPRCGPRSNGSPTRRHDRAAHDRTTWRRRTGSRTGWRSSTAVAWSSKVRLKTSSAELQGDAMSSNSAPPRSWRPPSLGWAGDAGAARDQLGRGGSLRAPRRPRLRPPVPAVLGQPGRRRRHGGSRSPCLARRWMTCTCGTPAAPTT